MSKPEYSLENAERDFTARNTVTALHIANTLAMAQSRSASVGAGVVQFALYGPESVRPTAVSELYDTIEKRFRTDLPEAGKTAVAWFRPMVPISGLSSTLRGFGMIDRESLSYHVGVVSQAENPTQQTLIRGDAALNFSLDYYSAIGQGGRQIKITGGWRSKQAFDDGLDWSHANRFVVGIENIIDKVDSIGGHDYKKIAEERLKLAVAIKQFGL